MPGACQDTNVPSSAEITTIAAIETMLAEVALTLFLIGVQPLPRADMGGGAARTARFLFHPDLVAARTFAVYERAVANGV